MNIDPNLKEELEHLFAYMDDEDPGPVITQPRKKRVGDTAEESRELGVQSLGDNDVEGAIRHFQKSVEQRNLEDPHARVDLGGAYEYADMEDEAESEYLQALDLGDSHAGIAALRIRYGRFREAVAELERAIAASPTDAFFHFKLAKTLHEAGDKQRALAEGRRAMELDPAQAFFPYWLGDLLLELGRHDEALSYFRLAIDLSPGDDHLLLRSAVAFWGAGKRPEAIRAVRLAGELDPAKLVYYGLLEQLLSAQGQHDDAHAEAVKASQMDRYDRDMLERILPEFNL